MSAMTSTVRCGISEKLNVYIRVNTSPNCRRQSGTFFVAAGKIEKTSVSRHRLCVVAVSLTFRFFIFCYFVVWYGGGMVVCTTPQLELSNRL
jgi:hypothetical protein